MKYWFLSITTNCGPLHFVTYTFDVIGRTLTDAINIEAIGRGLIACHDVSNLCELSSKEYFDLGGI